MVHAQLVTAADDMIDDVYEPYEIRDVWTSEQHTDMTDKVKRYAKRNLADGQTLGEAVTAAVTQDCADRPDETDLPWHLERISTVARERNVDLEMNSKTLDKAHLDKAARERLDVAMVALESLHGEETDNCTRFYAAGTIVLYAQTRPSHFRKPLKLAVAAAQEHFKNAELNDDQKECIPGAIELAERLLVDAIRKERDRK